MKRADYIFETSWEICNKVGGIHTVISTKAFTAVEKLKNNYICVGPDLSRESNGHPDFVEDSSLYKNWLAVAHEEGLRIRIGRWKVSGNPIVILVDFSNYYEKKNEILTQFWLKYNLDSISGHWDYTEPALFGYAAGKVIDSFYRFHCSAMDNIVAHFHEWMTGAGILFLEDVAPQIATVFTTHATVLGRSIAGNGLPLYSDISQYNPQDMANRFDVQSKFSLESLSANIADAFSTVSEITNQECSSFLQKAVDIVTINGFENNFVPQGEEYLRKRRVARQKLVQVASSLLQQQISLDALFVINSGRYEFKNKGIDLFIKGLARLRDSNPDKEVVAFITVPAGTSGQREDLLKNMTLPVSDNPILNDYATHPLHDAAHDPIIQLLKELDLNNSPDCKIKVVFVPVYLNGYDGIFNLSYYDLLVGFDLSVFPSYYEPWGYTPLESVAFGIPTVATSLSGFGTWVKDNFGVQKSAWVIDRGDTKSEEVITKIAEAIYYFTHVSAEESALISHKAVEISQKALWKNLYDNYLQLYDIAISKSNERYELYKNKTSGISLMVDKIEKPKPKWKRIIVKSALTENLKPLNEIAYNLWWSWNYQARELFIEVAGEDLWKKYEENPVHLLQMLPLERIDQYDKDKQFLKKLSKVYYDFKTYMNTPSDRTEKKVAYFSMEFGISNELKIFSGGLGMLAGDYLKEASDCNVNMVGVGLLYRNGYFAQQIALTGDQVNLYPAQSFSKLPIVPLKENNGDWKKVSIALPGRNLYARIWRVDVGRIHLYLLDTDFNENSEEDRKVTGTLYGGDIENRLKQEILLGIGGIRMLNMLGETPEIFHLNEGHAAFSSLERIRVIMQTYHVNFQIAMELVKASSLFTTHTPVPAGHDAFSEDLMRIYFSNYPDRYNITWDSFMALGRKHVKYVNDKFSMSILACHLSQEINGVSRIHGRVSREMFEDLYEGHFADELHIGYVTNGVHYPTWTHKKWQMLHFEVFGNDFLTDCSNPKIWHKIIDVDDEKIWKIKEELRGELIDNVKRLLEEQMSRRNESPSLIVNTLKSIRKNVLTVGFARRFATYKRAHLLFTNESNLNRLLNNPSNPIQLLFAGKAHPEDKAGQDLIKKIIEFSRKPEFMGKIIFVENYDMILAKKMISGCDVWLNTPERPMEASGTSGEKAVMNGVLNFSVLDGWWAEGYTEGAGWALDEKITYSENRLQDELDTATLFSIFEEQIAPAFYKRNKDNIPTDWVMMMKKNFAAISPHFTMKRQIDDYYAKFYSNLERQTNLLYDNNLEDLHQLWRWKMRMITLWNDIEIVRVSLREAVDNTYYIGTTLNSFVELKLGSVEPDEVKLEMIITERNTEKDCLMKKYPFVFQSMEDGVSTYKSVIDTKDAGMWNAAIRMIPFNKLLPNDLDFNLVKWI